MKGGTRFRKTDGLYRGIMRLDSLRQAFADIVTLTRRAFVEFGQDEMAQRSAALAYYALFSLFPLILIAISLIGFMLEAGVPLAMDAQTIVLQAIEQTLPQAKELVEQILVTTRRARGGTGLVGLIVLAWSASNIFTHTRLALNAVWDTGQPQGLGGVLQLRLKALGMAIGTGLLLFISTLSDTIIQLIERYVARLPWSDTLWLFGRPLLLASVTVILFGLLYRYLPRAPLSWADVWPGAIVGGVGWEVLKRGFIWYTTSVANWAAIYGPIAGVIGLLLWLYLSAQVLLFGAEFAAVYSRLLDEKQAAASIPSAALMPAEPTERPFDEIEGVLAPADVPPSQEVPRPGLAKSTAVGLVGAGVAGGLAIVGLLATGRRLLTRRNTVETGEGSS
jgi:membrane protein